MDIQEVGFKYIAERLSYFDERTVRNRLNRILSFLGLAPDDFKNANGDLRFDEQLADYIVWLIDQADLPFLKNSILGKETTFEDALEFHNSLLAHASNLEEPLRSKAMAFSEQTLMRKTVTLYEETMSRVQRAMNLIAQLPVQLRVENFKSLHDPLDNFIASLERQVEIYKDSSDES